MLAVPLVAAAACWAPMHRRWASGVTVAAALAVLGLVVRVVAQVASGAAVGAVVDAGMLRWVAVDGFSALMLLLIATVAVTAAIFSSGYLDAEGVPPRKRRLYYVNYNLFVFSMLAIPAVAEPTLVWIVVELTTLCSALLVSFDNTHAALEAAWKYVVLSLMGAGLALFGFLVLFAAMQAAGGGSYTWSGLIAAAPRMPPMLLQTAFVLIVIGLGTKVGLVPMHTWLPDAHSQAPSPVCALLSGVETTAILYAILRLFPVMAAAPGTHARGWVLAFGLLSVGVAAFLLLQVRDYKRLFAYSTVEHMGIIFVAAGLGGPDGSAAAIMQMISHSMTKSFCFFGAGAALLTVGTREISAGRGLLKASPVAGASLLLGALAIGGAPPFAVFLSEFSIFRAGLNQREYLAMALLAVFITIAFFGILLHVSRMVFGEPAPAAAPRHALPAACTVTLLVAAIPVLLLGVYQPPMLHRLITLAASSLGQPLPR
jgi:hydrogenase-4 component F